MRALQASRNYLAQFFDACRVLRAPLLVSLFAFVALSLPPQTREVYRVLADDFPNQHWQVALGFVALLVASGFIWHCGRQATLIERQKMLERPDIEGALLRWMPRLLAALVPLGAALGLYIRPSRKPRRQPISSRASPRRGTGRSSTTFTS